MTRYLKWLQMLCLRLYKKSSFIAIMAIIPLCILGFSIASQDESGFLHIVLAQQDKNDAVSSDIIHELKGESSIIRYSVAESPEAARRAVSAGQADAAWIFPKKLDEKLDEYIKSSYLKDEFVTVVERESTVTLRLSQEKLSAMLFKSLARSYYLHFIRDELPEFDGYSDEKLLGFFDTVSISEELFSITDVDGNKSEASENVSYLTAPVRGMLSVIIVLSGMAAALYCIRDDISGTFSWVAEDRCIYVHFACIFIAVINVAATVFIALTLGGLSTGVIREIAALLLYSLCCSAFCLLLKLIFRTTRLYSSMLPILIVAMIAVCPVFFDYKQIRYLQMLLPPTMLIKSGYDGAYFIYMIVYAVICFGLCIALDKILRVMRYKTK